MSTNRTSSKVFKAGVSILLALIVVFVSLASANPAPHKLIHADAGSATHVCAITLFAKGHVSFADVTPVTAAFVPNALPSSAPEVSVIFPLSDVQLASSRGPPAL